MGRVLQILLAASVAFAVAGCATEGTPISTAMPPERQYAGAGQDPSLIGAMNEAKMDAVRKAVIDLIGAPAEQADREALAAKLYSTRNPNAYVVPESFETTKKDKIGEDYLVECRVLVRMEAVAATLDALGLRGAAKPGSAGATGTAAAVEPAPTADEEKIILNLVERMTWMVYFAEHAGVDPFAMKTAVAIANQYFARNAMEAVDLAQVERLKKDQQKAWEAETGASIGIVQWIAQKLNADVYLEIDGAIEVRKVQGTTASAAVVLKIYEASTARLLGSVSWNGAHSEFKQTEVAAVTNAMQLAMDKAMPLAVGQARARFAAELKNGIKYGLVLQRTADATVVTAFRNRLKERVKNLKTVSQADAETTFEVWLVGSIEDLADLVVSVAGRVPGLEGLRQVLLRGRSITFNTGM